MSNGEGPFQLFALAPLQIRLVVVELPKVRAQAAPTVSRVRTAFSCWNSAWLTWKRCTWAWPTPGAASLVNSDAVLVSGGVVAAVAPPAAAAGFVGGTALVGAAAVVDVGVVAAVDVGAAVVDVGASLTAGLLGGSGGGGGGGGGGGASVATSAYTGSRPYGP